MKENIMQQTKPLQPNNSHFLQRHGTKLLALLFWATVVGGYYLYANQNDFTLTDSLHAVVGFLTHGFPSTLLTLLGGFLFGPLGIIYTMLGGNLSALFAYGVGRYFGQGVLDEEENSSIIQNYTQRLRQNSFETVLVMRLLFLPYDLVNYAAGFLKISWKPFLAATAIGSLPGTISVVLFGSSFGTLEELMAGEVQLNPVTLGISVVLILVSIGLSRVIKKREVPQK